VTYGIQLLDSVKTLNLNIFQSFQSINLKLNLTPHNDLNICTIPTKSYPHLLFKLQRTRSQLPQPINFQSILYYATTRRLKRSYSLEIYLLSHIIIKLIKENVKNYY